MKRVYFALFVCLSFASLSSILFTSCSLPQRLLSTVHMNLALCLSPSFQFFFIHNPFPTPPLWVRMTETENHSLPSAFCSPDSSLLFSDHKRWTTITWKKKSLNVHTYPCTESDGFYRQQSSNTWCYVFYSMNWIWSALASILVKVGQISKEPGKKV